MLLGSALSSAGTVVKVTDAEAYPSASGEPVMLGVSQFGMGNDGSSVKPMLLRGKGTVTPTVMVEEEPPCVNVVVNGPFAGMSGFVTQSKSTGTVRSSLPSPGCRVMLPVAFEVMNAAPRDAAVAARLRLFSALVSPVTEGAAESHAG